MSRSRVGIASEQLAIWDRDYGIGFDSTYEGRPVALVVGIGIDGWMDGCVFGNTSSRI